MGKTILPALLNLVLRERIDGKNYIVLATEDGEQMTEEYTDEVTGKTMKRKLKGQFSNTYWWYFPSPANSLWAKEAFAVSTDDEAFLSLRNEEKEDLKGKMMEASADLSNFIDVGLDYEIASCRLDPAAGRACLSKIAPKPILYWNYFSKAMKTGNLRVATDAPADKRTLFEIFSEVANAQPAHEKLYEAFEKMYAENNKLQPLKSAVNELKEKIDSLQSPDAEEQRKKEEENLSKKEEELKLVTEEFEKHRAIMDACADSLTKTRDFLKEKLPYLKEVAKDIDGTAGQKAKPAAAAQPNLPGNNNNTAGGVPQVVVPKHLFKIGVTNLVGSKNDPNDIDSWIKGGRKVKYKFGNKGLFDVLDTQWGVIMPAAGFVLPAGKVPKEADVEKAVRANVLKIEKNGNEYYVVLTVRQIQQNIP